MDCYDNRDGLTSQEWEAFGLFMAIVDAQYCVDLNKIYVAGYSTGGWLTRTCGAATSPDLARPAAQVRAARYHLRAQAARTRVASRWSSPRVAAPSPASGSTTPPTRPTPSAGASPRSRASAR